MSIEKIETKYDENQIQVLEGLDAVRKRPGMYIGKLGDGTQADDGIYVLLKEVVDNSIDEFIMGAGKRIEITIEGDKVTLKGDGNVRGTEQCHISHIVGATKHLIRKDKTYSPDGRRWRYYSALWPKWPFARRVLLAIHRRLPATWR